MKKFLYSLSLIIFCSFIVVGCSNPNYINFEKKKSNNQYTTMLKDTLSTTPFRSRILNMTLYKEIAVDEEDNKVFLDMLSTLKDDYFVARPSDLPQSPLYRIYITSGDDRYVLDVYGDDLITIYPWDGVLEKDFISLKNIPNSFKMEPFCKYVFEK